MLIVDQTNNKPQRLAQELESLSKTVAMFSNALQLVNYEVKSVHEITKDLIGTVTDLNSAVLSLQPIIDCFETPIDDMMLQVTPVLEKTWESAQQIALEEAESSVSCWKQMASELRTELQTTLNTDMHANNRVLKRCLEFVSFIAGGNLVHRKNECVHNHLLLESSTQICRSLRTQQQQRIKTRVATTQEKTQRRTQTMHTTRDTHIV
jgi:hypothetical protein